MTLKQLYLRSVSRLLFKHPALLPALAARYRSQKIIGCETANQLLRLARIPHAYKLTTIGVETSNTCNLKCVHCPTNREMKREKGYMEFSMFQHIIDSNPELERVYLTNWGEPLLHPRIIEMLEHAHSRGKHVALTTNAVLLDRSMSRELLKTKLDIIKFSVDGVGETYSRLRGTSYENVRSNILQFIKMRDELNPSTWVEVSTLVYDQTFPEINSFYKTWEDYADFVNFKSKFFSIEKPGYSLCKDLWRILVVLWNGKVVPCCADYEGALIVGDATQNDLQSIFKGEAMKALRRKHLRKKLPELCQKCTRHYSGYHISPNNLPV